MLDLKSIVVPEHSLKVFVHAVAEGQFIVKALQYALSVAACLSYLEGHETVIKEVQKCLTSSFKPILGNLNTLVTVLKKETVNVEIQGVTLDKFSSPTSKQAKLYRLLRVIDQFKKDENKLDEQSLLGLRKIWTKASECLRFIHDKCSFAFNRRKNMVEMNFTQTSTNPALKHTFKSERT
jgi:hypothetical protein